MQDVHVRKISAGTILKLVGVGLMFSLFPLILLAGCTAAFGINSLVWNGQPLHGWVALVAAPFMGIFLVAMLTATLGSAVAFGVWVYSWFGPFSISYRPDEPVRRQG